MSDGEAKERVDELEDEKKKKHQITGDDLYRRSTQYQMWSYTSEALAETKNKVNDKGRQHAIKRFEVAHGKLRQKHPEAFQQFGAKLSLEALLETLTVEEEMRYLVFYSGNIIKISNSFRMPTQVKATAVSFFKKFYLVNSVMEYHPKNVLYTCVFLAAKSENYFMSIESFCKPLPKTEPKDILDLEFLVLLSLKFTLLVHHPFRPLYGFFLDFQSVLLYSQPAVPEVSVDTIGLLYDRAKKWLTDYALLSDITFLFSPPQIALAALYDTDRKTTELYLTRKLVDSKEAGDYATQNGILKTGTEEASKMAPSNEDGQADSSHPNNSQQTDKDRYNTLMKTIRKCAKLAKEIAQTTRDESTEIDKKCFYILNPTRLIEKRINRLNSATSVTPVPN